MVYIRSDCTGEGWAQKKHIIQREGRRAGLSRYFSAIEGKKNNKYEPETKEGQGGPRIARKSRRGKSIKKQKASWYGGGGE